MSACNKTHLPASRAGEGGRREKGQEGRKRRREERGGERRGRGEEGMKDHLCKLFYDPIPSSGPTAHEVTTPDILLL